MKVHSFTLDVLGKRWEGGEKGKEGGGTMHCPKLERSHHGARLTLCGGPLCGHVFVPESRPTVNISCQVFVDRSEVSSSPQGLPHD